MMNSWGWGFGSLLGIAASVFFWLIVAFLIVAAVKSFKKRGGGYGHKKADKPLRILKMRYAKGEITKKEFLEMKKDIS